eukprot:361241-Chlamydomonas_euryale.AAC.8
MPELRPARRIKARGLHDHKFRQPCQQTSPQTKRLTGRVLAATAAEAAPSGCVDPTCCVGLELTTTTHSRTALHHRTLWVDAYSMYRTY